MKVDSTVELVETCNFAANKDNDVGSSLIGCQSCTCKGKEMENVSPAVQQIMKQTTIPETCILSFYQYHQQYINFEI